MSGSPGAKGGRSPGAWSKAPALVGRGLGVLLLTLMLGPAFAMGVSLLHSGEGATRGQERLAKNVATVDRAFRSSILFSSLKAPATKSMAAMDRLAHAAKVRFPLVFRKPEVSPSFQMLPFVSKIWEFPMERLARLCWISVKAWVVKILALTSALPLLVLCGLVGLSEGLVRRDLRRWSAGRESASVYHFGKRVLVAGAGWSCAVFLCLPVPVPLGAWLVATAMVLGAGVLTMASRFRKYL